jgi:type 1 fimbriae regulatory protein FimB/type 1 fimbriae regulatory protein FimE
MGTVVKLRQAPKHVSRKVAQRSAQRRYLTEAEVERLVEAARKGGRYGERDAALVLIGYRHGLRVAELVGLRWSQVDLKAALMHVSRAKNGTPSVHPLTGRELRALRSLQRAAEGSPFVFNTERGSGMTTDNVRKVLSRAAQDARLALRVHPHMLRHACGYTLANKGTDTRTIQAYLGHRSIQHTVRYTELAPGRFNGLFAD